MVTHKKRQIRTSIGTLLRWLALSLLFVGTHALAQTGGTVTYVYTDPQGTPLAEADTSGNITVTFEYTPYGTYAPTGMSKSGPTPNGPGYTGHVNDPETNLVYMQARYYDPATGHFLSVDPVATIGGDTSNFNRYDYANNNPILNIDPDGRDPFDSSGASNPRWDDWRNQSDWGNHSCPFCLDGSKSAPSDSHTSGWQWLILGFTDALCKGGFQGACDEAPLNAQPVQPETEHDQNWLVAGTLVGQASILPLTRGEEGPGLESSVIAETLAGKGNFQSSFTLSADQTLNAGLRWLGPGYKEIGASGSGVFRSADGLRQFRMDNNSLLGSHAPGVPHVHFEIYTPNGRRPIVNNHVPFTEK